MPVNLFDVNFYRAVNPDLANLSPTQASAHFQTYGLSEGRRFSPFVDLNFYRASNLDLTAAGLSSNQQLLSHLQAYGINEGRRFSPFVDLNFYRASNLDLTAAGLSNGQQLLSHLQTYGINEGRQFSQFINLNYYLEKNTDVNQFYRGDRTQALQHLEQYGLKEGRSFSKFVDLSYYKSSNTDLVAAGLSSDKLLEHLEIHGLGEGRRFTKSIDVRYYLANNPDLKAANFNNAQAYDHFVLHGQYEYRITLPRALYNQAVASLPTAQGWLDYTTLKSTSPFIGNGSQTLVANGGTRLVSDTASYTGYSNYTANTTNPLNPSLNLVNAAFPGLDRTSGFRINFDVKINSENHNNVDRAGFSIVAISNDLKGIELGFWTNQIWAQQINGSASVHSADPNANANLNTTVLNHYNLVIQGNAYKLYINNLQTLLLSGALTDYSSFSPQVPALPIPISNPPNPYQTPNFLFLGDDTTSAGADITLGNVAVVLGS